MKSKTLAIAGSIAALSLVGGPIATASAAPHHAAKVESRVDRSLDSRHAEKSPDRNSGDRSSADSKLDR